MTTPEDRVPLIEDELLRVLGDAGLTDDDDGLEAYTGAGVDAARALLDDPTHEALIRTRGRPALPMSDGGFDPPTKGRWRTVLRQKRRQCVTAARGVGRIGVQHGASAWIGTAWMIADDVAVTNRHVAAEFAHLEGGRFVMRRVVGALRMKAWVYFGDRPDEGQEDPSALVAEVLYIAPGWGPDVAFLKLQARAGSVLPRPLALWDAERVLPRGAQVANIGFPVRDARSDHPVVAQLFDGVYGVKRLAPGTLLRAARADGEVVHDCTTLGGCSGSPVIELELGQVIGMHARGRFRETNRAVGIASILRLWDEVGGSTAVVAGTGADDDDDDDLERVQLSDLDGRTGYRPEFLGVAVPLPTCREPALLAPVAGAPAERPWELRYQHYSLAMHTEHRLAVFTAVNIDGASAQPLKREPDRWYLDPRVAREHQLGQTLYRGNTLDRGHLVRRIDPAWGDLEVAQRAVRDTYFYTNCAPQEARLNRKRWLRLEEYLLSSAVTRGFKATVFTGPVFDDAGPRYRELTRVPRAYWKVAVMARADDPSALLAVGYLVGQADLITDLEFAFDGFGEYQVPIARIEGLTGLGFGPLRAADALDSESMAIRLDDVESLFLGGS